MHNNKLYKQLIFDQKKSSVYEEIQSYHGEIYVWGCGSVANGVRKSLKARDIEIDGFFVNTDNYNVDSRLINKKIYSLKELLQKKAFSVIIGHSKYELISVLEEFEQIENVWLLPAITLENTALSKNFVLENLSAFANTYELLEDQLSKANLVNYINAHLSKDEMIIVKSFKNELNYFNNDVIKLNGKENYIDVGAFNGDSIESFIKASNNNFNQIIGIEVLLDEYLKLKNKYKNEKRILLYNIGISDHIGEDYFVFDTQSTHLTNDNKGTKTNVTTLDNLCSDTQINPSLIKICIGDSITPILHGASNVIKKHKPKLVIAAGIDKYALIDYIETVETIAKNEYKYFLRFTNAMTEALVLIAIPR